MHEDSTSSASRVWKMGWLMPAVLPILWGCRSAAPEEWGVQIAGTVAQYNGDALPGGEVLFYAVPLNGYPPRQALIGEDGRYGTRLAEGTYQVAVSNDILRGGPSAGVPMPKQAAARLRRPVSVTAPEHVRVAREGGRWLPIHARDQRPETSGLVCTVNPDTHVFDVRLRKP